jgi:hypothetical protein
VYGYGVVDLVAALTADVSPLQAAGPSGSPSPTPTNAAAAPAPPSAGNPTILLVALAALLGIIIAVLFLWWNSRSNRTR